MKLLRTLLLSFALLLSGASCAQEEAPSPFDYWILSLSWSPQFCAENRESTSFSVSSNTTSRQCSRDYAFIVHGLWPQYETGYPKDCDTSERVNSDLIDRMMPLMPDPNLVRHEWRTHGACSGLGIDDYFMTLESAYRNFEIPEPYRDARANVTTRLLDLKRDFMNVNPQLEEDEFVLVCNGRFLREVRVCYDRSFRFRSCGEDVQDRCKSREIILRPKR